MGADKLSAPGKTDGILASIKQAIAVRRIITNRSRAFSMLTVVRGWMGLENGGLICPTPVPVIFNTILIDVDTGG